MSKKASNPPPPVPAAKPASMTIEELLVGHLLLLGRHAKDLITGFEGVIDSISYDLYGCVQVAIAPPLDKDGKRVNSCWFDVTRLEMGERVIPMPCYLSGYGDKVDEGHVAAGKKGPADKPIQEN